jgi:hypothetical protein
MKQTLLPYIYENIRVKAMILREESKDSNIRVSKVIKGYNNLI